MTVCVAAIFQNNSVLGASDRMLTAGGNIEFEPPQPKIWILTTSIIAMVADDILVHAELHQDVLRIVNERVVKEPQNWWKVSDVAELYSQAYSKLRRKRASKEILEPLGLDFESFISRQKEMSSDFIKSIEEKLTTYKIGGASTILAGIDSDGPHIYTVQNENISCNDAIGFAVIGIGYQHAAPHFMFSGHTRNNSGPRTLLTVHQAKRKSEVASGVGKGTDMFVIGPQLGSFNWIEGHWVEKLNNIYESNFKKTEKLNKNAEGTIEKFLNEQFEKKKKEQKIIDPPNTSELK